VGNVPALGNWSPAAGVALTWISGTGTQGNWRVTNVALPASSSIQYKYIKKDGSGNVVWESGANRVLGTVGAGGSQTVNDTWK
jgi:alpha-amylase